MRFSILSSTIAGILLLGASAFAQVTITPLASFGGGDGWIAPGDTAYLSPTDNNSRGLAFNPTNNHLYQMSRTGGTFVRILNATTGADLGTLDVTGIAGGTFILNKVVVDPVDGTIWGANLRTGTTATTFRLYRWANESAAPTLAFDFLPDVDARVGDNLDLIGSGANSQILAGYGVAATAPASNGYLVINPTASAANPTLPAYNNITFPEGTTATTTADGDFRLGTTFISAANSNAGVVLGTQGLAPGARLTSYTGAVDDRSSITGTLSGNFTLTALTERAFDYAVVNGTGLLATLDTSTSAIRLYDFTNPSSPLLLGTANATTAFNANANAAGDIRFGLATGNTINLYAMNTNNGIQAFAVTIPEPSSALSLGLGTLAIAARRRRLA